MSQATLVQVDATLGRIILTPTYSGADLTPAVIIERTEDGGDTWQPVRGDLFDSVWSMQGGSSRSVPDAEAPIGKSIRYRSIKATLDGDPVGSTFNLSATVVIPAPVDCGWFFHPIDAPAFLRKFIAGADAGATWGADRGIFYPVSAPTDVQSFTTRISPVVTMGRRQRRSSAKLVVCVRSNDEADAFIDCVGPASIICVRSPDVHGWRVRYIAVGGIPEKHPTPVQAGAWEYTLAYVEVDRPTVATVSQVGATYDQLAAAYATYADLDAAYTSYNAQTIATV